MRFHVVVLVNGKGTHKRRLDAQKSSHYVYERFNFHAILDQLSSEAVDDVGKGPVQGFAAGIPGLPPEEARKVKQVPGSLDAVLRALEADHDFLLKGDVFTSDMLSTYIAYKRETEVDPIRMRPHPYEFSLYYDI